MVAEESLLEEANLAAKQLNALDRSAFKKTKASLRQGLIEKVLAHHDVGVLHECLGDTVL